MGRDKNKTGGEPPTMMIGDHLMKFDNKIKLINASAGEKFLQMKRNDGSLNMDKVSPFMLKKCIDGIAGVVNDISKLRDGSVLIHTKNAKQASKLVQLVQINDQIHVNVTEHERLNSSKGVIFRCFCLMDMTDEEVIESFNDQEENSVKITGIKRVTRKVREEVTETGTYFITFGSGELPKAIYAGYNRYTVLPYAHSQ